MGAAAARDAAAYLRKLLSNRPTGFIRVICAAAPSQRELLAGLVAAGGIDWRRVECFHMDEYVGLAPDAPQLFSSFLRTSFWDAVSPGRVHVLDGNAPDVAAECTRYAALLAAAPIDVVLAGIGENGHLAFNDPPVADFADSVAVKRVELELACRQQQVNDGCFPALGVVPTHAVTLTIPALTTAGSRMFCVVPGPTKRVAVSETLGTTAPPTTACPASILRRHPACTLYVDTGSFDAAAAAHALSVCCAAGVVNGRDYRQPDSHLRIGLSLRGSIAMVERDAFLEKLGGGGGAAPAGPDATPLEDVYLAPGLVDLQVNGLGGVDFNELGSGGGSSSGGLGCAVRALWAHGVTSLCPTLITSAPATIEANLHAMAAACRDDSAVAAAVCGVHLEGPFISALDGYRGAHPAEHVLPVPDWALFERWQTAAATAASGVGLRIRIVTLAAELEGALAFIARAAAAGVLVSLGHSAATDADVAAAVAAGARMSTHLGNGLPAQLPRHPNALWAQLACDGLWAASVIADGLHVPDALLAVVARMKGAGCLLVSDSAPLAGCAPGRYTSSVGGEVQLEADGRLHLAAPPGQTHVLAGSTLTLERGVARMLAVLQRQREAAEGETGGGYGGLLRRAWDMASVQPSATLGLDKRLELGLPADLVRFRLVHGAAPPEAAAAYASLSAVPGIQVLETWKAGERVFRVDH